MQLHIVTDNYEHQLQYLQGKWTDQKSQTLHLV